MSSRKEYIKKWKNNYDFKTLTGALFSMAVTLVFAFYNGFLWIAHNALWYATICVYYLILTILRGTVITAERKTAFQDNNAVLRSKVHIGVSILLLILNLVLCAPISLMVIQQKPIELSMIPAIAMAAYTTYKVIMASINQRRKRKTSNTLVRLLRTVNFIDALVSVLTLQNTLIMISTKGRPSQMIVLSAITSGAILLAIICLSVADLVKGIRDYRKHTLRG